VNLAETGNAQGPVIPEAGPARAAERGTPEARQPDAIYQNNRIVARVVDVQVHADAREIRFGEVSNGDELLLPEDCEFQKYRILVQHIDFASREERGAAHKGRVLKGVVAEILGYREQQP
jgi:hypothetical protein